VGPDEDTAQRLRELQHEIEALAHRLDAAASAGGDTFTGTDVTGAVEVVVTGSGAAAEALLRPDWRDRLRADGLGPAVVAASSAAATARLSAWGAGMAEQAGAAGSAEAVSGPVGAGPVVFEPGDPGSRQSQLAVEDLLDLIYDLDGRLPAVLAASEVAATTPVIAENHAATTRVTMIGGSVTRVDFDAVWLRSAQHQRIAAAITETLIAAHQTADARRGQALEDSPGFARLRQLTESPEKLLREVGLIR